MMKKALEYVIAVSLLLISACQPVNPARPEPTSIPDTAVPTIAPTATATEAAEEQNAPGEGFGQAALLAHPWKWVSYTGPMEKFEVEMPESYVLSFSADGQLNIKADCNNAMGDYTANESSLAITVGPMTRAACPPDSRSDQFVRLLGGAALYFFTDGNLNIDLMADGGTLTFTQAGEPGMVEDQMDTVDEALLANTWQWVGFTNPVEKYAIETPQNYLLTFNADGTVNIKADCNNAIGSYTLDGSTLSIQVGPMTMAACPTDSLSDKYVGYLGYAAIRFFQDGHLFIDLFADGGTLEFAPLDASS